MKQCQKGKRDSNALAVDDYNILPFTPKTALLVLFGVTD